MFQKSIFIKIIQRGFLLLAFSNATFVGAEQISLIKLEGEKGWLYSGDTIYSSNVGKTIKMRSINPVFSLGYIFSKNWSFAGNIPFGCMYTSYSHIQGMQEEKRENIFTVGNIGFTPKYRFKRKDNWIEFPLNIQVPTLNKISGNLQYEGIEKERRIFGIGPGIVIIKTDDPIVSSIRFSFTQPLWREKDKKEIYKLWTANVGGNIYFLINEQFSFFSDLGVYIGKEAENYILQSGVAYQPKPYKEWRVYLFNNYDGIRWGSSIGLSFTILQRMAKVIEGEIKN